MRANLSDRGGERVRGESPVNEGGDDLPSVWRERDAGEAWVGR